MNGKFYYPIKSHYSQTKDIVAHNDFAFYYPIKSHYSQTIVIVNRC